VKRSFTRTVQDKQGVKRSFTRTVQDKQGVKRSFTRTVQEKFEEAREQDKAMVTREGMMSTTEQA
jgi:hypothetical protein